MSNLRLIIFSDLHYTDEEQNWETKRKLVEQAEPILEKLIEKINNTKELDAVINLGDFIQATKYKERDLSNIKKIWNKCQRIKYPFYTILGNHEFGMMDTIFFIQGGYDPVLIIKEGKIVFPFVWMVLSALKTKAEVMNVDQLLPAHAQWQNFSEVLFHSPMLRYIGNSLFISLIVVAFQLISSAMLTYAMVFMKFRGRKLLFAIVMGTYMLPTAATYIPSYIILAHMGLLDSYTGLIISDAVNIFGIFLLRTAFMQVPQGLIEAARIDGAGHWKVLWRIITPMTKSAYITFGLISFITMYNSYMWPSLITNNKDLSLVSQGLRSFFIEGGAYGTEWPKVMAASAVIVVPLLILFAFTQKWFINGIGGDTGVKG